MVLGFETLFLAGRARTGLSSSLGIFGNTFLTGRILISGGFLPQERAGMDRALGKSGDVKARETEETCG